MCRKARDLVALYLNKKVIFVKKLIWILAFICYSLNANTEQKSIQERLCDAIGRADKDEVEKILKNESYTRDDMEKALEKMLSVAGITGGFGAGLTCAAAISCGLFSLSLAHKASIYQKQKKDLPPMSMKVVRQILFQNNHPGIRNLFYKIGSFFCASVLTGVLAVYFWKATQKKIERINAIAAMLGRSYVKVGTLEQLVQKFNELGFHFELSVKQEGCSQN